MLKRLFDLIIALLTLVITLPIMLIVALAIRLDSPGPVFYCSPRMGRGGKRFGMMRFRTVDIHRPSTLPMNARLTRVGRFIRHYSLDDLPNLFNLLIGDLSCIGPRPTEPERVDLSSPLWQQVLTVRPGLSPAILQLGARYNSSPYYVKQRLELAYVQKQSFWLDLQLLGKALRLHVTTGGNVKRGKSQIPLDFAAHQLPESRFSTGEESRLSGAAWSTADLAHLFAFAQASGGEWTDEEPQCLLIPCADGVAKPAIVCKIHLTPATLIQSLQLSQVAWTPVASNRYLGLGLRVMAISQDERSHKPMHHLWATVLNVADPAVTAWFATWTQMAGALPLLIILSDLSIVHVVWLPDNLEQIDAFQQAAQTQWRAVNQQLSQGGYALDNFIEERTLLRNILLAQDA